MERTFASISNTCEWFDKSIFTVGPSGSAKSPWRTVSYAMRIPTLVQASRVASRSSRCANINSNISTGSSSSGNTPERLAECGHLLFFHSFDKIQPDSGSTTVARACIPTKRARRGLCRCAPSLAGWSYRPYREAEPERPHHAFLSPFRATPGYAPLQDCTLEQRNALPTLTVFTGIYCYRFNNT
eukprot:814941-Prorocentrum_minimum.AAC.1